MDAHVYSACMHLITNAAITQRAFMSDGAFLVFLYNPTYEAR
jgi:hypothetical protein